jgi:hypothetical protein
MKVTACSAFASSKYGFFLRLPMVAASFPENEQEKRNLLTKLLKSNKFRLLKF